MSRMKNILKEILSTSVYLLVALCVAYLIITYVGQRTQVKGASMECTLYDEDTLIVDKISYRFSEPERFDIIVFPYQYKTDTYYIKRIIGLPGETVRIDLEGNIYITAPGAEQEELLVESYGKEIIQYPGLAIDPVVLDENEYFVLGDNRNNSSDSRSADVGNIKREDIIGRAWLRIWPLEDFKFLDDK